jgi:hypothetical protein
VKSVVVCCPEFDEKSGGSVVLHELFRLLDGVTSVTKIKLIPVRSEGPHGWTLTPENVDRSTIKMCGTGDVVVIYPESVFGNPLGARRVIRWLLNTPGLICDTHIDFQSESVYSYMPSFGKNYPPLRISVRPQLPKVCSKKTIGVAFLVKKALKYRYELPQIDDSWVCIDHLTFDQQLTILSRSTYFISFDPHTMLSIFATMLGCRSLVPQVAGKAQADLYPEAKIPFVYGDFHGANFGVLRELAEVFMEDLRKTTMTDFQNLCLREL